MTIEVLIPTLNQVDFNKLREMNIQSDCIIANQSKVNDLKRTTYNGKNAVMITTNTKGVGLNRNIALLAASADILLLADDDVKYYDGYEKEVLSRFTENPKADVIVFGMNLSKNSEIYDCVRVKNKRIRINKLLRYGTYVIAVRRESILKRNIMFNQLFGGGCKYSHGEDSKFLLDCYREGLKIYGSEYVLGICYKDFSTCFCGYNKQFFFNKGAWSKCAFPRIGSLYRWYIAIRLGNVSEIPLAQRIKMLRAGVRGYRQGQGYQDYILTQGKNNQ